ncbi:rho gtpase activation protein [Anaeramoeba flamelloides]|uniref:Rho gtpase activation protein n=1 Tax=Anaeramoeba flamelloides TaxID=1746091 RepID=A0AAV7ZUA3_9EUKA|nr:rho gtpase activation protein [Anaeramoeba flamelloides]
MEDSLWYELYDTNNNCVYYYNPDTEESVWNKPTTIGELLSVVNDLRNGNKPDALKIIQDFESEVYEIIPDNEENVQQNVQENIQENVQENIQKEPENLVYDPNILSEVQMDGYFQGVPKILQFLGNQLSLLGGANTPGIFQNDGDSNIVNEMTEKLKKGDLNWNATDINVVTTLFFNWLTENQVSNPIIKDEYYDSILNTLENEEALLNIILSMPEPNKKTLAFFIQILQEYVLEEVSNVTGVSLEMIVALFNPYIFSGLKTGTDPDLEAFFFESLILILDTFSILESNN